MYKKNESTEKVKVIKINGSSNNSAPGVKVGISCPCCNFQVSMAVTMNRQTALALYLLCSPPGKCIEGLIFSTDYRTKFIFMWKRLCIDVNRFLQWILWRNWGDSWQLILNCKAKAFTNTSSLLKNASMQSLSLT